MAVPRRFRQGGVLTYFSYNGIPVQFARQVSDTSPVPVGPGVTAIQPLDAPRPIELIVPAAAGPGTLVLDLYEVYGAKVWDQFFTGERLNDIVDIFHRIGTLSTDAVTLKKFVTPPAGSGINSYWVNYVNPVISNVEDNESIAVDTMEIIKRITVTYVRAVRSDGKSLV